METTCGRMMATERLTHLRLDDLPNGVEFNKVDSRSFSICWWQMRSVSLNHNCSVSRTLEKHFWYITPSVVLCPSHNQTLTLQTGEQFYILNASIQRTFQKTWVLVPSSFKKLCTFFCFWRMGISDCNIPFDLKQVSDYNLHFWL